MSSGGMTYFLLHEADRHQYNPKELSLSKNEGHAFLSATWGPRGSGPNSSCALLTLMSSSRIALHFSSSFHLSWQEVAVFSETLFAFFEKAKFKMRSSTGITTSAANSSTHKTPAATTETASLRATKKRRRSSLGVAAATNGGSLLESAASTTSSVTEYAHKCGLLATMTVAWSPFVLSSEHSTTSLIAFSGRKVSTVWGYAFPRFASSGDATSGSFSRNNSEASFLSPTPVAWIDTEKHGWVATSTWQQMHYERAKPTECLTLAMGTASGNVLLANVPVVSESSSDGFPPEIPVDRVILAPHCQPVFNICLGSRDTYGDSLRNDLVVASGSTISVWNVNRKRPTPVSWKAHDGNITGLSTNYFGDAIFSCGVDGKIKVWDKETAAEILFKTSSQSASNSSGGASGTESKYPLFGLAVSPSSAQVVCVHIIPPAARPNRKSQADVSYSRVSSALEYLPSPSAKDPESFVSSICRVLEESKSVSTFTDVLWFCHEDNAAITSLHGSSDMTIPNLLNKLKGVSGANATTDEISRQPLYLNLCESLEKKYLKTVAENQAVALGEKRISSSVLVKQNCGFTPILYLQASYLLRSSIPPAENHLVIRDAALTLLHRTLYGYWAERSLTELVSTHSQVDNFAGISASEMLSALLMADFLSVQEPLSEARERLVTTVYTRLGSEGDHVGDWLAYLQTKTVTSADSESGSRAPTPPSRQTCFICEQPVPFAEFELFCALGHVQERCFLSFQVIASMDSWKCMGCGALACELPDVSTAPFYLLESQQDAQIISDKASRISCRLCGNFCSFFKY